MKATILWGGTMLGIIGVVPMAPAGGPACSPALHIPLGTAPDACGPGFYATGFGGACYGPNYWLVPPFPPFNGILPGKAGAWIGAAQHGRLPHAVMAAQMAQQMGPPMGHGHGMGPGPGLPPGYPGMMPPPGLPVPGYGPNLPAPGYDPRPVALPAYGMPPPAQGQSPTAYPVHPYARSPRDFFMWREEMEDRQQRERRPGLVP